MIRVQKSSLKTDNKKSKAKQRIRTLRGKYKHLDLIKGLIEARKEERQPDSKTRPAISARSLKMLDKSAASLKKGLASEPIAIDSQGLSFKTRNRRRSTTRSN
jgi:hypothetical protein